MLGVLLLCEVGRGELLLAWDATPCSTEKCWAAHCARCVVGPQLARVSFAVT